MEEKSCLNCEKIFKRENVFNRWKTYKIPMSDYTWKNKKYCSERCQNAYESKRYRKTQRGKEYRKQYTNNLSSEKKKEYSQRAYAKFKIERERMKKEDPESYNKYLERARQCAHKNKNHQKARNRILEAFNYSCALCGYKEVLDVHHLNGKSKKNDVR